MTTHRSSPPVARDFDAYRLVKIERLSTRRAAEELGISQTRICQVVRRVGEFLLEAVPEAADDATQDRQLAVAQVIAAERVDFLFGQAVRSFERSQGEQRLERESAGPGRSAVRTITTRQHAGDPKYLAAAARLAVLGAKLPAAGLLSLMPEEDESAPNPSPEDCSAAATKSAVPTANDHPVRGATIPQFTGYTAAPAAVRARPAAVTPAVQAPETPRALTPQQRRARQAFLAAPPS